MALKRTKSWDTRELHEFLLARSKQPFAWGVNDCALFAADAVLAMTGVDIADDFRGKYHDEAGAWALVRAVTGKGEDVSTAMADAAAWCAEKHGLPEWVDAQGRPLPLMARRGDLVVARNAGRLIAGIVHLNGTHVVSVDTDGLKRWPMAAIVRAWSV
jgi:hypothetical protein